MVASKLVVVWRVTEVCDLACPFCAYSRELRRSRASADRGEALRFGALLGEYARKNQREALVSWLGGEPLLWKPIWDVSRAFRNQFGLRVSVTTNGTMLDSEEVRRCITEDFDEVTVSVDGVGPDHDRRRQTAGLYDRLEKNVRRLKEQRFISGRGPRIRVNTVLMRDSIHSFESLCVAVAGWGVEELTFNILGGRDRPEFFPGHSLQPEQIDSFRRELPRIRERAADLGLSILGSERYLDRLSATITNHQLPITDCSPGQSFLFVDERGFLAPCSFTTQGYGVHLSEIRAASDLQNLSARFAERKRAEMLAPCYDCHSTQVFGKFSSPLAGVTGFD
ncbi:MAG TPA: radical SAM protein [Anaerolineales bacterium]|nr:radical SAM protein [Anaerolineales bacterium]